MNLEIQFCSLELSKKLLTLGVKQDSLYAYINSEFGVIEGKKYTNKIILTHSEISNSPNKWPAFTASELMMLLPGRITLKEDEPFNSFKLHITKSFICENNELIPIETYIINYECDSTECTGENAWLRRNLFTHNIWDKNFSNALAKTLIYIYENNLLVAITKNKVDEEQKKLPDDVHRGLIIEDGKVVGLK